MDYFLTYLRYLEILDSLFDSILSNMNQEGFTFGDKYKAKYDELGKRLFKPHFFSSGYFVFSLF